MKCLFTETTFDKYKAFAHQATMPVFGEITSQYYEMN